MSSGLWPCNVSTFTLYSRWSNTHSPYVYYSVTLCA